MSAADVIRQFGVDTNAVLFSDGILRTPEGLEYEDVSSGNRDGLSSESSNSSGSDEDKTSTSSSKPLTISRVFRRSIQQRRVSTARDCKVALLEAKVMCAD